MVHIDAGYYFMKAKLCEFFISFWLGYGFALGVGPVVTGHYSIVTKMALFVSSCSLYHFMEYMFKCQFHPWSLSWHDF